ncbi:MAG TPA: dihydroorotase [Bacteroidales bacterium]|nr:dihydroorotase [Bacteroidales bacterium]
MSNLLITNATVINEGHAAQADILTRSDRILSIMPAGKGRADTGTMIIDATDLWLLPGVIDSHVHFREPGLTHKGDIYSESAAAAAGGVTSFMDMPNTVPQTTTLKEWQLKNETAADKSVINYSFYLGATNSNGDEIAQADPHKVCGIKVFLGASTGKMLVDDEKNLDEIFSIRKLPVACHCEDEATIKRNSAAYMEGYGDDIDPAFHPLIRSREACFLSSSDAVARAKRLNTKLHLLHLSTAEEMDLLTPGEDVSSKKIIGEACVHYLWFDDSYYATRRNLIKWNPAIKRASDMQALRESVIDGKLDIISTDHAPHTIEEKRAPYFKAPSGGPLIQHSLVMMLELCHIGVFSPELIVRKMCHNPATVFNIMNRGFIREGYKADLVLVNPDSPWTVTPDNILYKCGWSPLEGTTFRSRVVTTIVNGRVVFSNGLLTGEKAGEMLLFDR